MFDKVYILNFHIYASDQMINRACIVRATRNTAKYISHGFIVFLIKDKEKNVTLISTNLKYISFTNNIMSNYS